MMSGDGHEDLERSGEFKDSVSGTTAEVTAEKAEPDPVSSGSNETGRLTAGTPAPPQAAEQRDSPE